MSEDAIQKFGATIKDYILEKPEKRPKNRYVNLLVLRELLSAVIRIGETEETVGKLFGRKQVASDRRTAKAVQRALITDEMKKKKADWDGCSMEVTKMCQKCPECALFGSAASEGAVSMTSRVMYDEAYTIRSLSTVVEEFFQNAPGDAYVKNATSGIREPDFFKEGVLFPCVVTLKDVTLEEVLFFMNITDRNSRYGATGTRFGKVRNHILGVYAGGREGPSSLEVTREIILALAGGSDQEAIQQVMSADTLDLEKVKAAAVTGYEDLASRHRIACTKVDEAATAEVLDAIKEDSEVASLLTTQLGKLDDYLDVPKK
ncbi:type I-D CRISPR-associated protein Cas7/Csc2 [uncultured Methanofollis sp.]|uniref:type I-D CRISPR-associated protein Cas7/Csc2 n=1 Tax=uncultured Methanofollis sp. TaxID=262500 RepID=UPI00260DF2C3|nr:type I-D CRISPR-associated protein Cas7/Csc2 [uncultured Methanofollis sp.]